MAVDKNRSILNKIDGAVSKLDKKLDLHIQKMDFELNEIKELDAAQNKILAEHAARSNQLEKDNLLREQKLKAELEAIKAPFKFLAMVKQISVWLGAIAVSVVSIIHLLKLLE